VKRSLKLIEYQWIKGYQTLKDLVLFDKDIRKMKYVNVIFNTLYIGTKTSNVNGSY